MVGEALAARLDLEPMFTVVKTVYNGRDALNAVYDTVPDVALINWHMPVMDGLTAARNIKHEVASVQILVFSDQPADAAVFHALRHQIIRGFMHKTAPLDDLIHALVTVSRGDSYMDSKTQQILMNQHGRDEIELRAALTLTPREMEVLELMATSATYREIGDQLHISEETVRTHTKRVLTKLNQPNRTQGVLAALRIGLLSFNSLA